MSGGQEFYARPIAETDLLKGPVDNDMHCCYYLNNFTITLFDAARVAVDAEFHEFLDTNFHTCLAVALSADTVRVILSFDSLAFVLRHPFKIICTLLPVFTAYWLAHWLRQMIQQLDQKPFLVQT